MLTPSMDSRFGAIVLCGGESKRMGRDKATLPWGPDTTLLQHVVSILEGIVPALNIVVVAGHNQRVPKLPSKVWQINESATTTGSGPLAAIAQGLTWSRRKGAVFVCGCDAPLLRPEFVRHMLDLASTDDTAEALVPTDGQHFYPLAAVYRPACSRAMFDAYVAGERSLHRVLRSGAVETREVPVDELRAVDSDLDSLINCNTPDDYQDALKRAGLGG